ncbi:PD-(D/E)XK nuclease family protein [Bacillus cereus]|uniref:PD-(D/E)XK nuclease family protein n=1 Tax=Bacillus cereus TaxID=1396 RepID=UPI0024050816|nr:PD-(D/E)XK nuclease family protein [Bacillus cereus]MDF9638855.1 PD-(D/E)XK nuclease family protein [Bacillus cereus]
MVKKLLVSRGGASELRNTVTEKMGRGVELTRSLKNHFNKIHSLNYWDDIRVERLLLQQKQYEVGLLGKRPEYPSGIPRFSPSGSDKCSRELFFKILRMEQDEQQMYPFQRRWTLNSTGVHEARQRDLLYGEIKLKNPDWKVERMISEDPLRNGLPAWERNVQTHKVIEHNGVTFLVFGMMDGILEYKDGSRIGFEFKTKSNSVAQVNERQLKEVGKAHKLQCVAYSILFGIDEFIVTYESVAKDKWSSGDMARDDMRMFYVKVTDKQRKDLLDKWAEVAVNTNDGEMPFGDNTKCLFCPFKTTCSQFTGGIVA